MSYSEQPTTTEIIAEYSLVRDMLTGKPVLVKFRGTHYSVQNEIQSGINSVQIGDITMFVCKVTGVWHLLAKEEMEFVAVEV